METASGIRCVKCGAVKPETAFYLSRFARTGRVSWCKECCSAYSKERRASGAKPRLRPSTLEGHKFCPCCETYKPLLAFSKSPNGRYGRQSWCKDCFHIRYVVYKTEVPDAPLSAHPDD